MGFCLVYWESSSQACLQVPSLHIHLSTHPLAKYSLTASSVADTLGSAGDPETRDIILPLQTSQGSVYKEATVLEAMGSWDLTFSLPAT